MILSNQPSKRAGYFRNRRTEAGIAEFHTTCWFNTEISFCPPVSAWHEIESKRTTNISRKTPELNK